MRVVLAAVILFCSCTGSNERLEDPIPIIEVLMRNQEIAWNNGNLEEFMRPYWKSDSLLFIGKNGPQYGWQQTLANYKKAYPTKDDMGILSFENEIFKPINNNFFWLSGKWKLYRATDTLSGNYTLLWKKIDGEWKIISDHSS